MASKPKDTGSNWTQNQQTGQAKLNDALNSTRRAPAQGNDVPAKARRTGSMDN